MEEENKKFLVSEELEEVKALIEEYKKIYLKASAIGRDIEKLQTDMVKVSIEMTNKSDEENKLYRKIADRLDVEVEEARAMIMKELEKNMNNKEN